MLIVIGSNVHKTEDPLIAGNILKAAKEQMIKSNKYFVYGIEMEKTGKGSLIKNKTLEMRKDIYSNEEQLRVAIKNTKSLKIVTKVYHSLEEV